MRYFTAVYTVWIVGDEEMINRERFHPGRLGRPSDVSLEYLNKTFIFMQHSKYQIEKRTWASRLVKFVTCYLRIDIFTNFLDSIPSLHASKIGSLVRGG